MHTAQPLADGLVIVFAGVVAADKDLNLPFRDLDDDNVETLTYSKFPWFQQTISGNLDGGSPFLVSATAGENRNYPDFDLKGKVEIEVLGKTYGIAGYSDSVRGILVR